MHGTILVSSLTAGLRNLCELFDSSAGGCARYGITLPEYALLLVLLPREHRDVFFTVYTNRSCFRRMDDLSTTQRIRPGIPGLQNRNGSMAHGHVTLRRFYTIGRFELCVHDSEHAYERNGHDEAAIDDLGFVLHRRSWNSELPGSTSGCILLLFDRHMGTSFYLSDIVVNGEVLPMKVVVQFCSSTCSVFGSP